MTVASAKKLQGRAAGLGCSGQTSRPTGLMLGSPFTPLCDGIASLLTALPFRRSKVTEILMTAGGADMTGPRSPYKDSLAALHEIATSPGTYVPPGVALDSSKPHQEQQRQLHVGGSGAGAGGSSQSSGRGGAHNATTSPMFQGLSSPFFMVRGLHIDPGTSTWLGMS